MQKSVKITASIVDFILDMNSPCVSVFIWRMKTTNKSRNKAFFLRYRQSILNTSRRTKMVSKI